MYRGHIGWNSSKLITRTISLGPSHLGATTSAIHSKGNTPKFGRNRLGRSSQQKTCNKPAISLQRGKIGPKLLLMTNRKSHTRYRLVPKSMTLDDLERPFRTLFQNTCVSEPITKISMKIDPNHPRQRCSAMTLFSGNIRFMRTFAGVLGDEASNNSGVIKNVDFQGFRTLRLRHLRK